MPKPTASRRALTLVVCAWECAAALAPTGRVLAHTELEFSLPANGTTVGEPVAEISVGFTDIVALVGNGFQVHDPQGNVLEPFAVTDDDAVFRLQLDPPLGGGVVTVEYQVRSLDGHEIDGSFSFTVAADAPVSTTSTTTTTPTIPTTAQPTDAPTSTSTTSMPTTTTVTAAAGTTPSSTSEPEVVLAAGPLDGVSGSDDESSSRTLLIAVLLGVAALAGGFVFVRTRLRS